MLAFPIIIMRLDGYGVTTSLYFALTVDPYTGEIKETYIFVGVMTYSQYAYVEAFPDEKQQSWIDAHVHMYEYFGGVAKILVPDNCKTAIIHNNGWKDQRINAIYHELAEHYGTAIIPARVRKPKDKPNAVGSVGNIATWIVVACAMSSSLRLQNSTPRSGRNGMSLISVPFKRKRVADTNSSTTRNCHY